jgi:cytochrome c oxidase cbb3-type subunit 2
MPPTSNVAAPRSHSTLHHSGWRGIGLIAITYVYFLIFAQFAFLKRLATLNIADAHLKAVMAAMAVGGIGLSLLTPRSRLIATPRIALSIGLSLCGLAALLTTLPLTLLGAIGVSLLIGCGLGVLTVTLVTHLRLYVGTHRPLLKVGLGTGIGYLICNLPFVFTAPPEAQAWLSAALCVSGIGLVLTSHTTQLEIVASPLAANISFPRVLLCFTALVWLDSAAFFIIQQTPALKAGTWQGSLHLWINGGLHLLAAVLSAFLLRRRGTSFVLALAYAALAMACVLLLHPGSILLASVLYPIGVSLYSVALVAYPSLLAPAATVEERARHAGWIYAIAGWFGSAMGIGMGQNLGHVPVLFVAAAGVIILGPLLLMLVRSRPRETAATAALLLVAAGINRLIAPPSATAFTAQQTAQQRGRQVYISEGCIHCHSQYVRPNTRDELMWGPTQTIAELRSQHPPLIGNRRQGPDLSEVGNRRSPLWLRAHFMHPAEVSYRSFMPAYGYLFAANDQRIDDTRGDDLIAYLSSLHDSGTTAHLAAEQQWYLSAANLQSISIEQGARLFQNNCTTCHTADGATRNRWLTHFKRLPPNLYTGPYLHLTASDSPAQRQLRLARIVKFGIPGTDMPGHEYLPDAEVFSLALWLNQITDRPLDQTSSTHTGDSQ